MQDIWAEFKFYYYIIGGLLYHYEVTPPQAIRSTPISRELQQHYNSTSKNVSTESSDVIPPLFTRSVRYFLFDIFNVFHLFSICQEEEEWNFA